MRCTPSGRPSDAGVADEVEEVEEEEEEVEEEEAEAEEEEELLLSSVAVVGSVVCSVVCSVVVLVVLLCSVVGSGSVDFFCCPIETVTWSDKTTCEIFSDFLILQEHPPP